MVGAEEMFISFTMEVIKMKGSRDGDRDEGRAGTLFKDVRSDMGVWPHQGGR